MNVMDQSWLSKARDIITGVMSPSGEVPVIHGIGAPGVGDGDAAAATDSLVKVLNRMTFAKVPTATEQYALWRLRAHTTLMGAANRSFGEVKRRGRHN